MRNEHCDDKYLDYFKPVQVEVMDSARFEDSVHKFRALVTKERIMSSLKEHAAYEKPSDKKRRQRRESLQRQRKLMQAEIIATEANEQQS
jgi:ribosomal protein S21